MSFEPSAKPLAVRLAAVASLLAVVGAVSFLNRKDEEPGPITDAVEAPSASAEPLQTAGTTVTDTISRYKNGTYSSVGTYSTPGGTESVTVQLTLQDGIVKDATVTGAAKSGDSAEYQQAFIGGYKAQVIGKSIDSVSLSRVSGSSLTSRGFNAALSAIKTKAAS